MTAKVVVASPETSLAEAARLLAQGAISGLPVVDA
ncbi:MAG: CBS domain-containing protein, partial [Candidatus Binatia bacterium]